jgi:leucyl-tRNA synthetase
MATYDWKPTEAKWQARWEADRLFACDTGSSKPKYYCLMMFPYPSGDLHVGHGRNYIIGDVLVRYRLMRGYEVLSPMGWDAFGLPAENAAIKRKVHPSDWTKKNIGAMKAQFTAWGVGYDWSRELATCDPSYYKWTQWIFLKLHEQGLAYRKKAPVNWCGSCNTVLANEQVVDGKCERCGSDTTKRDLEQWFFRITDYAQRLLDDLDKLPRWSRAVIDKQRARIGRSEGAEVFFQVKETGDAIPCFTTRPDTLWGVTFFSIAPEHPLVEKIIAAAGARAGEIRAFCERIKKQTNIEREKEKEGVASGWHVVNPVNGDAVPLFLANYVLPEYGTGGVMAVPAHDQRDFEFAKKYSLPVKVVIQPRGEMLAQPLKAAFEDDGEMVDSAQFSGKPNRPDGIGAVVKWLGETGKGKAKVNFKLHDWCVSRQRYWGAPIPMIHCPKDGPVPVPVKDLPVELPRVEDFTPKGRSVLEGIASFVDVTCPKCGGPAKRDPDTLDTFVDSAWYYLRYPDPKNDGRPFEKAIVDKWLPVDQYVGGIEHAVGHLLYSRFITKVLKDAGELSFDEPFEALFTQGMIEMISYRCEEHGWVGWRDVENAIEGELSKYTGPPPVHKGCGRELKPENFKMSKTRGNLVSAAEMGDKFGVDTQRLYTLAVAPADLSAQWKEQGVIGYHRFLHSLIDLSDELAPLSSVTPSGAAASTAEKDVRRKAHETTKKVTNDLDGRFGFHTAIASLIELKHAVKDATKELLASPSGKAVLRDAWERLLLLLSPFAPYMAEELWEKLGQKTSIFRHPWPTFDEAALARDEVEIGVQVNGKLKDRTKVPADAEDSVVTDLVLGLPKVKEATGGKAPKMVKVVKNRLVNIVV